MPRDNDAPRAHQTVAETEIALPAEHPDHVRLRRVERLADLLDTRFRVPILGYPIGLDGLIGLIPGIGDTVTTGLSGYLIWEAHNAGASRATLARMAGNVALDWALGLIPVIGDLVDIGYKANARNARLLADDLRRRHAAGAVMTPAPRDRAA